MRSTQHFPHFPGIAGCDVLYERRYASKTVAMIRVRASSISTVVTLVLVACVSLVSGLPAWSFYRAFANEQWEALAAMQRRGIEQLTISLELPAWNLDESQIDGVLDASMRNAAVDAVTVRLASGLSPHWRRRIHNQSSFATSTIDTSRLPPTAEGVITHDGEILGSVTLAVNADGVIATLLEMRHRLIGGVIAIDLTLILGLYLLLRWLVLGPIRSIQRFAADAESTIGQVVPATLAGRRFAGELEQLRETIVEMVNVLAERYGALIVSRQEISELNATLERRVADRTNQLDLANQELQAFSYSVSHDLRAPLRGIDGWSQALQEDCGDQLDATGHEYLQRVRHEAQRMGELIDDLLRLSRVTQSELVRETVDVSAMAHEVIAALQRKSMKREVTVTIEKSLVAEADSGLLRVVLENLLDNAWKFTSKTIHATIELGHSVHDGVCIFYIRDNGAGFDMVYADKLFSAFCRLHRSSEFSGTGIGLATVNRIIHRHGGRIWAEAQVGHGATFYFTLESQP